MATKMVNILLMVLITLLPIVNASPTSISELDHDVPTSNYSISTFNGSESNPDVTFQVPLHQKAFEPCPYEGNTDFADGCYYWGSSGDKYGIDRRWLIDAIKGACHYMAGGVGEPVHEYGLNLPGIDSSFVHTFTYPSTHDNEEGKIVVTLVVDDSPGCIFQLFPVSREYCWDSVHIPIDGCHVQSENSKNGGIWRDGCIWWIVDPAPAKNQPYKLGSLW